ncbi:MAG: hypothetical protein IPL79_06985 [Myxococcales bacterium]|nr:hypothetical protein [Myxococcales bacterium]
MFENYDRGLTYKRRKEFVVPGIIIAILSLTIVQVRSVWSIAKLPMPRSGIDVDAIPASDPPPPPPPKGGAKPKTEVVPTVKKIKVETPVQPVLKKAEPEKSLDTPEDAGEADGVEGGVEGGVAGGVVGGVVGGTGVAAVAPPPVPTQQTVPPTAFKANRISGNEQIQPDDMTKLEISRSGKSRLIASVKVCVDASGNVSSATKVGGGTGFASYDSKILGEVRKWRYRAFLVNGKAVPTCSVVQFIYMQK